ncbi:helix-turn-helix domain-containing protein [Streptomyces sp. S.PB5]|uniref:winged helix-turn-helix transcriptional regulator n=1 Tax=Streptomyces sp. S.PB5 TaxID=3020844 RepID=UPI0025B17E6F|nr:helix-turn-helix domain-containing protein [Streptomyces sp. S.PB5]MDN3029653.1 helix-turn-helix domain-containing protein [Streptomyces sp. S.PB5]
MNTADECEVSVFAKDCSSRQVLLDITGRWGILVLAALHQREFRFNLLRRRIEGISEKMLSHTLQTLRRDGLVTRQVEDTVPPRVIYGLSPLGHTVAAKAMELVALLECRVDQFEQAWNAYDE